MTLGHQVSSMIPWALLRGKAGSFCNLANKRDTWPEVRPVNTHGAPRCCKGGSTPMMNTPSSSELCHQALPTLPGVRTKCPAMQEGCVRKPLISSE